jgi:sensor histidine kinase regulating citrate/malate metabolism
MYDKLRLLRHDFKYHLSAARVMLRSGETQKADEYLNEVEEQHAGTEVPKYCENAVLNALIDSYADQCRALGIDFTVDISIPETVEVSNHDMCIVIGNLLENAVEACSKLETGRSIALRTQSKPPMLLIMVRNSFDGTVRRNDAALLSGKADGGYRLRSVREVLAGCGGDLYTEWDENAFSAFAAVRQ